MFPELENSVLELESLDVKEEINFKRELEEYESKVSDQVVRTYSLWQDIVVMYLLYKHFY